MLRICKKKTMIGGIVSLIAITAISVPAISAISKVFFASALDTIIYKSGGLDLTVRIDETSDNYDVDTIQIDDNNMPNYCFTEPSKNNVIIRSSCLDYMATVGRHDFVIKTRSSESANTHSFDYELSVTMADQVEVGTIGSHFNKDYSRGIMYRDPAVTVNSSSDTTRPFELVGFSSTITDCSWEDRYGCATNRWKNSGKISKITRGAVYNNEYLDVIEYTWKDNFSSPKNSIVYDGVTAVYGKSTVNGTTIVNARVENDMDSSPVREEMQNKETLAYTHREFHFYKTGTNFTEEVNFKGVVAFGDFEFGEGYVFKQGQKKVYVNGWGNSEQWAGTNIANVNGFVRPFSYTKVSENEIMLYAEVESSPFSPLHVLYVTPAHRNRGSNSMVQAAYVRYNFVGTVPSGATAPAYDTIVKGGTMTPTSAPSVSGYTFSGWYTNEAMTNPAGSDLYVGSDINLYGKYTQNTYTISTSITNGTITPTATVEQGSNKVVTYNCNSGYHLTSVKVDGSLINIDYYPYFYSFDNVTADHSVVATCTINTYTITTSVTNGVITPTATDVNHGSNRTISYSCNTGYHLNSVTVDGSTVSTTSYPSSYSFNNVTANHNINAVCSINTYSVTTSIENGEITPTNNNVNYGTNHNVEYHCNERYSIKSITVDSAAVEKSQFESAYLFSNVTANHDITVICEHDPLTVTTSIENGEITPTNDQIPFESDFNIEYNCNTGFKLESVTVNDQAVDLETFKESYQFIRLQDDAKISVICKAIPVGVETSIENGQITESNYDIGYGEDFEVKFTCDNGEAPLSIKVDDEEIEFDTEDFPTSYDFTELTAFHKIDVKCDIAEEYKEGDPASIPASIPDTGSLTDQGQSGNEEAGVMDYVLTGIMVLAGCAGTTLLIRFCLHSHNMKLDRRD